MNPHRILPLLLLLFLLLVACQPDEPPLLSTETAVSTNSQILIEEQPTTQVSTATPIPATNTLQPTATLAATATAVSTPTPIPNTVQSPETVQAGERLEIGGSWNGQADLLQITLQISDWLLTESEATIAEDGRWQATLPLPPQVSGTATLTVAAADDSIVVPLLIEAMIDDNLPFVTLNNPMVGQTAVSGYGIFFDGVVNRPLDGTIVIGILVDNCTRFATGQTFELGSGSWSGLLVIPGDIAGNACAIVRMGDPDEGDDKNTEGDWLAAIVPLPIMTADDAGARRILLGNTGELVFKAGEIAEIFGTAVNAPNNRVNVTLTSDDGSYILLGEAMGAANGYGYWETDIPLPDTYTGFALLTISTGSGDDYQEERIPILITK